MNKKLCEQLILEKIQEAIDIYHQYNPNGKYLNMVYSADSHKKIMINNAYWQEDKDKPLYNYKV